MFTVLSIISAIVIFVGLVMVLLDVKNIIREIGTGLFIFGLCAFMFFMIAGAIYKVPLITTTNYYASECNLDEMAEQYNAKVVYVNRDEKIVHKYSKKDNIDEWIYYKYKQPEVETTETSKTTEKVEQGYG